MKSLRSTSTITMAGIAAILCLFFSFQYQSKGTVRGTVTNTSGTYIDRVQIEVFQNSKKVQTVHTLSNGQFECSVHEGNYTLEFTRAGFASKKINVYVQADKKLELSVVLESEKVHGVDTTKVLLERVEYEHSKPNAPSHKMKDAAMHMPYGGTQRMDMFMSMPYVYESEVVHNTEEYSAIQENIFKKAAVSPISTFSVDVDRASYANVRRFINAGQKPDVGAVRIEEMINYFDYNYPQPTQKHPFSITIESETCAWNTKNSLVLIGLQGKEMNQSEIPANNLVFLIDVSGSMNTPQKLPLLKQSFTHLVERLRPQDRVSIVVYAGAAGLVLEPTSGAHKQKIYDALNSLQAGGSTAGGAGIQLAYKIAKDNFIYGGNNRVILASDGDFNVGVSSSSELVKMVESKRDEGVYLTILGFGMGNFKDSRFEDISNAGNGNYAYIDNIMEAKKIFGHELWGTLFTIAKDVKIQVEFNPAIVAEYRLIGYENRMLQTEDFTNDKKDAGEVGSGHSVTALYEIVWNTSGNTHADTKYVQQTFPNSNELLTVNVRYKQPDETQSILMTRSVQKSQLTASDNIRFASSVAQFGMLLRNSEHKGTSSYQNILSTLEPMLEKDTWGYRREFAALIEQARKLY